MVRVTNAVASKRRKDRIKKFAKGYFGDRRNHLRQTSDAVMKALAYSYMHRKEKKRNFRGLWIQRLSCAAKIEGISYSKLIHGLALAGCLLNRKMLSEMAISHPQDFHHVVQSAKHALATKTA